MALGWSQGLELVKSGVIPEIRVRQVELAHMQQPLPGQRVVSHQGVPRVEEQPLPADRH